MNFLQRNPELAALLAATTYRVEEIGKWKRLTLAQYNVLGKSLPPDHIWRAGKLAHVQKCANILNEYQAVFGLDEKGMGLITFLALAHDLGRVVQAVCAATGKERPDDEVHGRLSAEALREFLPVDFETPFWKAALVATTHHAYRQQPTLERCGGDKAVHALSLLLRSVDKITNYDKATTYTADAKEKMMQREVNWPNQIKDDAAWGTEMGLIAPVALVPQFSARQPLDRQKCRSYEAYMLQYVGWIFDIQRTEVLAIIVNRGGLKVAIEYLRSRLATTPMGQYQWSQIEPAIIEYLAEFDLSL